MSRKQKQPDLAATPVAPPPPPAAFETPRVLRYFAPSGDKFATSQEWQVERFDLMVQEFSLMAKSEDEARAVTEEFHRFASEHPSQWRVARRLFGIAPLIPSQDAHPDDLRIWTKLELEQECELQSELGALLSMWRSHLSREEQSKQAETVSTKITAPTGELELDDKILERFQFSERIFKINVWDTEKAIDLPRPETENRNERDWFVKRVTGWQKMLDDPMGGPVARGALMNDLYLRRMESEIATVPSAKRALLFESQQRLSKEYNTAAEKLQEMFPDLAVAGRISFRAVLSDVIIAHRDYYAHNDRRLVDRVFTAAEIEFLLRESQQIPAQYRFTLGMVIVENQNGINEPDFRSQFKPATLKKIDAMTRAAREASCLLMQEPVVDLERGVMPGEPSCDEFGDFNDEQCPVCGRWHPHAEKCTSPQCRKDEFRGSSMNSKGSGPGPLADVQCASCGRWHLHDRICNNPQCQSQL